MTTAKNVVELECSQCGKKYDAAVEQHLCSCGQPLLARYDLKRAAATLNLGALANRPANIVAVCGGFAGGEPVSLGEGMTALMACAAVGRRYRC